MWLSLEFPLCICSFCSITFFISLSTVYSDCLSNISTIYLGVLIFWMLTWLQLGFGTQPVDALSIRHRCNRSCQLINDTVSVSFVQFVFSWLLFFFCVAFLLQAFIFNLFCKCCLDWIHVNGCWKHWSKNMSLWLKWMKCSKDITRLYVNSRTG